MRVLICIAAMVVSAEAIFVSQVQADLVNWTSPISNGVAVGTLGSTNVALSGITAGVGGNLSVVLRNLSIAPYAFAPGSTAQETVAYGNGSDWLVTFDSPVTNLLLYADSWRATTGIPSGGTTTYEFDHPFTIAAGATMTTGGGSGSASFAISNGSTVQANDTLVLNGGTSAFFHGILIFQGPISSLSLASDQSGDGQTVDVTFGTVAIPEPSSFAFLGLVCCGGLAYRRWKE